MRNAMVGDVFLELGPFFKMYTDYVNNHPEAVRKLVSLYKRDRVKNFLSVNERTALTRGLDLESLLITPVQRIPRYKLLLEALLKCTAADHPDYKGIGEALVLVSKIADSINSAMRESQNRQDILNIQKLFGKDVDLVTPSRKFIMKGILTKRCRSTDKDFTFFLFNDLLMYAHGGGLTQYVMHRMIDINKAFEVKDLPDTAEEKNMIEILNSQKSFVVYAPDLANKQQWLNAMVTCINEMRSKRLLTMDGDVESAASWRPDKSSSCCTICLQEFSLLNRRHHCRKCGILVCDDCSKGRALIRSVKSRVCDRCVREQVNSSNATLKFNPLTSSSSIEPWTSSASSSTGNTGKKTEDDPSDDDDDDEAFNNGGSPTPVGAVGQTALRFKARQTYRGSEELGELDVNKGDPVIVQYSNEDESGNTWWYAQNLVTYKSGWIAPTLMEEEFPADEDDSKGVVGTEENTSGTRLRTSQLLGVYKATGEYTGNAVTEELGFNAGDIIDVLSTVSVFPSPFLIPEITY